MLSREEFERALNQANKMLVEFPDYGALLDHDEELRKERDKYKVALERALADIETYDDGGGAGMLDCAKDTIGEALDG